MLQKMALQAGGIKLPEIGMTVVENAGIPTKILCLSEVLSDFYVVFRASKTQFYDWIYVFCLYNFDVLVNTTGFTVL